MRWAVLGGVGFLIWLVATFAVVYAAVDLAQDDRSCEEATAAYTAIDTTYRYFSEGGVDVTESIIDIWAVALDEMIQACSLE